MIKRLLIVLGIGLGVVFVPYVIGLATLKPVYYYMGWYRGFSEHGDIGIVIWGWGAYLILAAYVACAIVYVLYLLFMSALSWIITGK